MLGERQRVALCLTIAGALQKKETMESAGRRERAGTGFGTVLKLRKEMTLFVLPDFFAVPPLYSIPSFESCTFCPSLDSFKAQLCDRRGNYKEVCEIPPERSSVCMCV